MKILSRLFAAVGGTLLLVSATAACVGVDEAATPAPPPPPEGDLQQIEAHTGGPAHVDHLGDALPKRAEPEQQVEKPAKPFALKDAQRLAGTYLLNHISMCPRLFADSQRLAFETGRQQRADGRFWMRARCMDDAYLVVVNAKTRKIEFADSCRAARAQFGVRACD